MGTSTAIVQAFASTTGQIITDSVPLLYYMFAIFMVGFVLVIVMKAIKGAFKTALK